jgi:hypothetical protein
MLLTPSNKSVVCSGGVQSGSMWFNVVQSSSKWFKVVQSGSMWFKVVQSGSMWFNVEREALNYLEPF